MTDVDDAMPPHGNPADRSGEIRVLHCTGSPVDQDWADLSRLYARAALDALPSTDASGRRFVHHVVDVSPGDTWRFVDSLDPDHLDASDAVGRSEALARLASSAFDVAVPQMFCPPGLIDHRSLLRILGIPSVGNSSTTMAITADKAIARAIVAAAGLDVPDAILVRRTDPLPDVELPAVVKPVDADNSVGLTLVHDQNALAEAVENALEHSSTALIERFVPAGREVRCGTIRRDGRIVALPLEEYPVNASERPIRTAADKLSRSDGGDLRLMAKSSGQAWIVADDDPIVPAVQQMARTAHVALGCDHHGLVDVRVDPSGRPWFIEAGPYCSFAPSSVVVTMAGAAGVSLSQLFVEAVGSAVDRETGS